jgi:hypothetical protein
MADPKSGGQKPFAEFLRDAPRHQGSTVTLTGRVSQSDKEGHFVLDAGGGQTVELPTESVLSYKVVEEAGKVVELQVQANALERKSIVQENIGTIASLDVHTLKEGPLDTIKETHKDPIFETIKELHKDPILDTSKEVIETIVETGGTLAETIGNPGQQVVQPEAAGGAVPFTLATAHQAPQSALTLQGLSGQVKPIAQDVRTLASLDVQPTIKETVLDTQKELTHDTLKELIHDTLKELHKDPILDTSKEVIETIVEGGGTIMEGGGTLVEGGGFPGGGGNQF